MNRLEVRHEDCVTWIGINRPEKRNALDLELVASFHAVLDDIADRGPTILVIHSATPGMFVAGTDINELAQRRTEQVMRATHVGLFQRIEDHRWPTIAVVDGPAIGGGCELALACDLRVGSTRAQFMQPELTFGILAGAGGNWRLPQLVGLPAARRLLYLGDVIKDREAVRLGLLDRLVGPDRLVKAVEESISAIRERSWRSLEFTKLALRQQQRVRTTEFDLVAQALLSEDIDTGARMGAFLQRGNGKRPNRKSPREASPEESSV